MQRGEKPMIFEIANLTAVFAPVAFDNYMYAASSLVREMYKRGWEWFPEGRISLMEMAPTSIHVVVISRELGFSEGLLNVQVCETDPDSRSSQPLNSIDIGYDYRLNPDTNLYDLHFVNPESKVSVNASYWFDRVFKNIDVLQAVGAKTLVAY